MKKHITIKRIILIFISFLSLIVFSCDDYGELKPVLLEHAALLEKTITAVRSSENSDSLCRILHTFNQRMESIISTYTYLGSEFGGSDRLFSAPPSPIRADVNRIRLLNDTLRDSLLGIHAHTENAAVRRALIQTADTLDKFRN